MKTIILSLALGSGISASAFAGSHYSQQAYWDQRWADMADQFVEQQYEAEIQQQFDMLAARQQAIEALLQQYDWE